MKMRLFKHRKTNNVIFSLFQANDAWSFLRDPQTPYDFYGENLDFLIKSQVKYAEIVGADYYHFRDDFVSLIKHSLPKLTKMKMFVQYYEMARVLIMDQLSRHYNKVLYLDLDVVPIKRESFFEMMKVKNSLYMLWFKDTNCPFYLQMKKYQEGIKDPEYKYKGHTNTGIFASTENGAKNFLGTIKEISKFIKAATPYGFGYVGLEHIFMYQMGKNETSYRIIELDPRWSTAMHDHAVPFEKLIEGNFLHFCGIEGKKRFKNYRRRIMKMSEEL